MKEKCLVLFFCLFCGMSVFSQNKNDVIYIDSLANTVKSEVKMTENKEYDTAIATVQDKSQYKKSSLYLEFLGNSLSGISINYDRIIKYINRDFIDASIGFGFGFPGYYNIPISVNYTTPVTSNSHFEVGLGTGLSFIEQNSDELRNTRLWLSLRMGYKYQRPQGGLYVRAGFTPVAALYYFKNNENYNTLFSDSKKGDWKILEDLDLFLSSISLCVGYSF